MNRRKEKRIMKEQVRRGVFETNSSSTHSITMCLESEYDKWLNGETFLRTIESEFGYYDLDELKRPRKGKFYTKEQVIQFLKLKGYSEEELDFDSKEEMEDFFYEKYFVSVDQYNENKVKGYYEEFEEKYTLGSGENIVAFGYYGYN